MEFTAHIRESDYKEQTVTEHCIQTAAIAYNHAKHLRLAQTAKLAGQLHDIGKYTADFHAYIHGGSDFRRGELDHSFAGAKYLKQFADASEDSYVKKTAWLIGRIILSHHGLNDWLMDDTRDVYQYKTDKDKYYDEILQNLEHTDLCKGVAEQLSAATCECKAIRRQIREQLCSDDRMDPAHQQEAFAFYLGMLERLLQSILIDADRTDTANFMSDSQTEAFYNTEQLWRDMQYRMQLKQERFLQETNPIAKQRCSISNRCAAFASNDVRICKLIVPTGGGKTLSSLRFAIEYANRHSMDKIIYIAPFMSILEQNSDIISEIAGEDVFLEHHSNMLSELAEDNGALHEYELRTEKWDSPVIATTMVQFLNTLFSGKSSAVRRMHRLSRAVIIIDEVQSIPTNCVYLFNLAMNFLSHICDSTIVLCSATQPPFEQLTEFPLMLDQNSSMTGDTDTDFDTFRRTRLIYHQQKGGHSYDEATAFCLDRFAEYGSLLVVVNTKAAAKALYGRLRETEHAFVYHLSTNMCPQHRRDHIAAIRQKLAAHEPIICVTTQLIEAGVDISFGCVVRSLAGMDNAAQAAGRCNRNGEYHTVCPVYILELREETLGNLRSIRDAKEISRELFQMPEDTDFLSVPLLSEYFRKLYSHSKQNLRYPLSGTVDQDLINLLSLNHNRISEKRFSHLKFRGQAFKTAGKRFHVIDSNTTDVIVPYDAEAKRLIAALESEQTPAKTVQLLRKAQAYAVSVYSDMERKLHDIGAIHTCECAKEQGCILKVLDARFYDSDYGIQTEGGEREILLY